nr:MetaGeneMark_Unknown Function [uncultured bacterium]
MDQQSEDRKPERGRIAAALTTCARGALLVLRRTIGLVLALIVLFEEWGWRPLADGLAKLARWRLWAKAEALVADLPPYLALCVFALPTALLFPLKLLALFLIAKGQAVAAGALFLGAKVVGTALVARIFQLTQPALMRIPWFAWAYGRFMPWKEAVFAAIRQTWAWRYGRILKARVKKVAEPVWRDARAHVVALMGDIRRRARAWFGQTGA